MSARQTSDQPKKTASAPDQALQPVALSGEALECLGDLRVALFAYPQADGQGTWHPEYAGLAGISVSIAASSGAFSDSGVTGDDGTILWTDIPVGEYTIRVGSPPGYTRARHYYVSVGPQEPEEETSADGTFQADVEEGRETRVSIGWTPQPARLRVYAFFDAQLSGDPQDQQPIGAIPVYLAQDGERFACVQTDAYGGYTEALITRPGFITLEPPRTIRVQLPDAQGGSLVRTLRMAYSAPLMIHAEPGQTYDISIPYRATPGEIRVMACLIRQVEGGEEKLPLPGVTFAVYRGLSATGMPLRQARVGALGMHVFTDLNETVYTVVARATDFEGQPLQYDSPADGILHITLPPGQASRQPYEFCFRPCLGKVMGVIIDGGCGKGVAGVPVTLWSADRSTSFPAVTQADGEYMIPDVPPGEYTLSLEEKLTLADGTTWTIPPATALEIKRTHIRVQAGQVAMVKALSIARDDDHRIYGVVRYEDDQTPVPFAVVLIQDEGGHQVADVTADEHGRYEYAAPLPGIYYVVIPTTSGGVPFTRIPVSVNQPQQVNPTVPRAGGGGVAAQRILGGAGGTPLLQDTAESLIDLTTYPGLAEVPTRLVAPAAPGGAPLDQLVDDALRNVLGWKVRSDDPQGFLSALSQSFTFTEVEGRRQAKWTPRSYAVSTDLSGGITGAQASLFTRARDALDKALPLLDGLYALRLDADPQDEKALRAVVRSQMTELVNELGQPGGPRVARVDQLFSLLLGDPPQTDPDLVGGQLGTLRDEFGLWSVFAPAGQQLLVNTIEEEQDVSNYRILVDYMTGLRQSWLNNRGFFQRPAVSQPFFGTQLVLLSRTLSVIAESVDEVRYALDSVFIGPSERQTIEIEFPAQITLPGGAPQSILPPPEQPQRMFIEELLSWVSGFATQEGPRLIQDGGKYAVQDAFLPVATRLRNLVIGATNPVNVLALPRGYRSPRVRRALQELATQLYELVNLAAPIAHQIPSQP